MSTVHDTEAIEDVLDRFPEPDRGTAQYTGDSRRHTDVEGIRRLHHAGKYRPERFDFPVIPDVFEHTWGGSPQKAKGGADLLGVGKPGSGKSTFLNHVAKTELEVNDAKVVWRGSPSRSEWLPLAPYTTLLLPADVDVEVRLVPKVPTEPEIELDVEDLTRIVREVVRYRSPAEINREILEPGQFYVVYPDPEFRDCQAIYERSDKVVPTPSGRDELFAPGDPQTHWWFAFVLDRTANGPYDWQTLILDEIGDIAPESASADQFGTYYKVVLLVEAWVDARKTGLTIDSFGHTEADIHHSIRQKIRWRMTMNGTANPTSAGGVVGFETVPMNHDLTSRLPIGQGLIWNQTHFEKLKWPDYTVPVPYKLQIRPRNSSCGSSRGDEK